MAKKLSAIRYFTNMEFFDNTCWKNEAASDERSTKRVIGIVAGALRNTRYRVCFLAENELPHVLRKSLAKKKSNCYLRIIGDKENVLFTEQLWLASFGKDYKRFYSKK